MQVYNGDQLQFLFDERSSTLDLIEGNDETDVYEQTIAFAFEANQSTLQLVFRPRDASYAVLGSCSGPNGSMPATSSDGALTITISPSSVGDLYSIDLENGSRQPSSTIGELKLKTVLRLSTVEPPPQQELVDNLR